MRQDIKLEESITVDISRMPHLTQSQKPWRGLILWLEISLPSPTP